MSNDLLNSIISDIETKIDSVDITPEIENVGEVFYL
jgi:bifunctional DNase/RNase